MLLQEQRIVCIKVDVIQSSGLLLDSTVLDETWALAQASNKPLYAFALLWTSYSLSFGDVDFGHNYVALELELLFTFVQTVYLGFPGGTDGKKPLATAGDIRDMGSISGLGRDYTPLFLSVKSHGQRSLVVYSP